MNILLVEDEENLGRLLKEELEEQGYTITWLKNGVDAVLAALETAGFGVTLRQAQGDNVMVRLSNHVEPSAERFDVLIVDMVMPDMSGINTIKIIKKIIPDIGIVSCSGKVEKDIMIDSIMKGATACLNKPFTISQMISQIKWVTRKKK